VVGEKEHLGERGCRGGWLFYILIIMKEILGSYAESRAGYAENKVVPNTSSAEQNGVERSSLSREKS
jgi:hypothetical protein